MVVRTMAKPLARGCLDAANPWWKVWASYQDSGRVEKGEVWSVDREEEGETQEKKQGTPQPPRAPAQVSSTTHPHPPQASPPCSSRPVFIVEASCPHQIPRSFLSTYCVPGIVLDTENRRGCDKNVATALCMGKCHRTAHGI